MIKAIGINKFINRTTILDNIDIELSKGSINILFGPSGSGKTTLCRNLALLDNPDSGSIEIFKEKYLFPIKGEKISPPYPQIGFVFQQLFLWPHLTNEQNIVLVLGKNVNNCANKFEELVNILEIDKILKNYPNETSIGQKQRVAIARALILNPQFIFFDEITSALDIVQTRKIVDLIKILKINNIGVLLITHNLELFKSVGDNFIFLQDGKILETGNSYIFSNPNSYELKMFLK